MKVTTNLPTSTINDIENPAQPDGTDGVAMPASQTYEKLPTSDTIDLRPQRIPTAQRLAGGSVQGDSECGAIAFGVAVVLCIAVVVAISVIVVIETE